MYESTSTMTLSRALRKKTFLVTFVFAACIVWFLSDRISDGLCTSYVSLALTSFCSSDIVNSEWNLFYHLGGNGPWIPKVNGLGDVGGALPDGCIVDQVHMLSRHAERYPTKNAGNRHIELLSRLYSPGVKLRGSLAFLKTWSYFTDLKDPAFENLTTRGPFAGTVQAMNTGKRLRERYDHLVPRDRATRFWSCSANRDVETAMWFADGFWGMHWAEDGSAELQVIPEAADRGGDTLTPGDTCLRYRTDAYGHDYGYHQLEIWQKTFAPDIAKRLASDAHGAILTALDVYSMMEMCGFEVLARGYSSWCNVFSHVEWLQFEYARDILHFYRAGPGNEFAPTMGWLYLNATAELLVNNDSKDVYFSFVHDGDVIPVLAALQIMDEKNIQQDLPLDHVKKDRRWRTSDVVPMGGRLIFERIACGGSDESMTRRYVRISINDALVKVAGIPPVSEVEHAVDVEDFWDFVASRLDFYGEFRDVCGLRPGVPDRITFLHQ